MPIIFLTLQCYKTFCNVTLYLTQVTLKRTNLPGVSSTDRGGMRGRGRGRGFRRGGGGGYFFPAFGGFMPMMFSSRGGRGRAMR